MTRVVAVDLPAYLKRWVPQDELVAPNGDIWLAGGRRLLELGLGTGTAIVKANIHLSGAISSPPVVGPNGEVWFSWAGGTGLGREFAAEATSAGQVREFSLRMNGLDDPLGAMASGSDGNVWVTIFSDSGGALARISLAGKITMFSLTGADRVGGWYGGLIPAKHGGFWTNTDETLGENPPASLTWVSLSGQIDRLSPQIVPMVLDNSGTLWGWAADGLLARVSDGASHELNLSESPSEDGSLVLGADGHLWFSAAFSTGSCNPVDPVECPPQKPVLGAVLSDAATMTWASPYTSTNTYVPIQSDDQMVAGPDGQLLVLGRPVDASERWELFSTVLPSRPVMSAPRVHILAVRASRRTGTITLGCDGQAGLFCAGTITVSSGGRRLASQSYALTPGLTGMRTVSFASQPSRSRLSVVVTSRDPDTGRTATTSSTSVT